MGWNIVGHGWAVELLKRHIQKDYVRHAYLFVGMEGVGKRDLALRFAQALNCASSAGTGAICEEAQNRGKCRACELTSNLKYPDLHLVEPEDTGGLIKVE